MFNNEVPCKECDLSRLAHVKSSIQHSELHCDVTEPVKGLILFLISTTLNVAISFSSPFIRIFDCEMQNLNFACIGRDIVQGLIDSVSPCIVTV